MRPNPIAFVLLAGVPQALDYPKTRTIDAADILFGTAVRDPYRWLEDAASGEVKAWMADEDRLARRVLDALPGRGKLERRLKELYYLDSVSAPEHRGSRYFYKRTHADREKAVYYWREGEKGGERVLLDPNMMSRDGSLSIGLVVPSWDGHRVAYTTKANNSDEATLHVMEVATGTVSAVDTIAGAKYAHPSWTPSGDGFYYTYLPPLGGPITVADRPGYAEVRFHKLGADPTKDALIHPRTGDPATFIDGELSRDGRWLFTYIHHGWRATDVYFRDLGAKDTKWRPLAVGIEARFQVEAWQNRFYIRTNDGAPRERIFRCEGARPERQAWREIVGESPDSVIHEAAIFGGHLVLHVMRNASSQLEVRTLDGKLLRAVALPAVGAIAALTGNPDEDTAYYGFHSFTHPLEIRRLSIRSGEDTRWAAVKVPIDAAPFTVDQIWFPSKDGTRVSMFLVHRKDLAKNGKTPFLLTGYGGFNLSMLPGFQAGLFPWLEAGGGFALPNLRGGGEYGEAWHRAGMGVKKQNVFDDFLAAADFLVGQGYTQPERLAIRGGSNGGLLMGAALTQRPELFRAVACAVPLLDMVRYHRFGSGKTWAPEYGSADDEATFRAIHAYSPYHRVKAGTPYPAVLFLSADSDDRVDPLHARKMAAALQASSPGGRPILLRIEKHAGHGGADLVKQAVAQSADSYAFLMNELGMTP